MSKSRSVKTANKIWDLSNTLQFLTRKICSEFDGYQGKMAVSDKTSQYAMVNKKHIVYRVGCLSIPKKAPTIDIFFEPPPQSLGLKPHEEWNLRKEWHGLFIHLILLLRLLLIHGIYSTSVETRGWQASRWQRGWQASRWHRSPKRWQRVGRAAASVVLTLGVAPEWYNPAIRKEQMHVHAINTDTSNQLYQYNIISEISI